MLMPETRERGSELIVRVGMRIRTLRREKGWSRKALGERAGLSERFLALIETGRGNPSLKSLAEIAGALETTPTALLETRSEHAVRRALDDRSADYELSRVSRVRLDAGGELSWELRSAITVPRDRPDAVRMEGRQLWRVSGGPALVEVRLEMWQTFEATAVRADVILDGRPFFAREWRLALGPDHWQIAR